MEARSVESLPVGPQWQYEPKWDGFRCLVFRDGPDVDLRSKSGQPLGRYFPEIVEAIRELPADRFVLDGELVIPADGELSFDALLLRLHPAPSRITRLSVETPALLLVFDLLLEDGRDLTGRPLSERRTRLEQFADAYLRTNRQIGVSPATRRAPQAREWLADHSGTDGVVAKRLDLPYQSAERTGMQKIKRIRTADCVVGGFRYATKGNVVGSLLLGLYDDDGVLHHVGFTSGFSADERRRITPIVERLRGGEGFTGRAPGGSSRWTTARSSEWEPLEPTLVVEVRYDHYTNGRFRHATRFLRWRPEKSPLQCMLSQVERATSAKTARAKDRPARVGARRLTRTARSTVKKRRAKS
jgi:ATP-dependent DNA ligase